MATKKPRAASVKFSQEKFDEICNRLASGGDENSLRRICQEDGMPHKDTFKDWSRRTPALAAQYEKAMLDRRDTYFDEMIEIADTEPDPQKAKVRIDARKWAWARQDPKRFGDRMTLTGDPAAPVQLVLNGSDVKG